MGINWISRLIIDTFLRLRVNYGGTPAGLKTEVNRVLTFNMLHQVAFSSAKSKSNHMKDFRFINIYTACEFSVFMVMPCISVPPFYPEWWAMVMIFLAKYNHQNGSQGEPFNQ